MKKHGKLAPERYLRAYADFLHNAIVHARFYSDRMSTDQMFDLMDALHNVPTLLTQYGDYFTDRIMRDNYLAVYDRKWATGEGMSFSLIAMLDDALSDYESDEVR